MYIAVIGVVKHEDIILMIRKKDPDGKEKYIFPGGHWKPNESFAKGAIREVYEEKGIRAQKPKYIGLKVNTRR